MTLDIRGSLKNTKINKSYYAFVDELLSNALDSYLIRKSTDDSVGPLEIKFNVEVFDADIEDESLDLKISCADNGAGLGDEQTKAFVTKDTSYKDDLLISGIGQCKGSGRIQFLHYFNKIDINSIFSIDGENKKKTLSIDEFTKEVDENSFITSPAKDSELWTKITLHNIKQDIYESVFKGKDLKEKFSAVSLKNHILVSFLQRLISLKYDLGDFLIEFVSSYRKKTESETLTPQELPISTKQSSHKIYYKNLDKTKSNNYETFKITHYELNKNDYPLKRNTVALCAKSSIALLITNRYLKTKTIENNPVNGNYHIIFIESDFLDENINEQRDGFSIPNDISTEDMFKPEMLSFEEIYEVVDDLILEKLAPPDWDRGIIVNNVEGKYGVSSKMIADANVRVKYGDTEESVVKRVLHSYQDQIIQDTSEIFEIKESIEISDPTSDDFRVKVNELAWKYTSSLKKVDMANLSQLVVRRAAILEILQLAIKKRLTIQTIKDGERQKNEEIIHNIFFPMRKDSNDVSDHDIWILNEEYQYFDYISSDKPLSKIKWDNGEYLFESDIDDELSKILNVNYEDNSKKRPDIAIFSNEGAVIIVEFKAPGVSMDAHIGDLMEYSQLLAAKSNGKLKQFYGYLIGDTVNSNRLTGYTRFPNGQGWFNTDDIREHSTGQRLGELYSEILYYNDIVSRANKRLDVYKKRLNIDIKPA